MAFPLMTQIIVQFSGKSQSLFTVCTWLSGVALLLYEFYLYRVTWEGPCAFAWWSGPDYLIIEDVF